ncbi:hypothetical protein [uncultured Thomasclavelia sp.]|uniref:hypothetical protein n=1 Tax=uncultured Thomasclavelia sp. TaxID=3025759 RepID=UPI0025FB1ABF|nr:hypothetical protein [uncultured Thomasclavelia sp.]
MKKFLSTVVAVIVGLVIGFLFGLIVAANSNNTPLYITIIVFVISIIIAFTLGIIIHESGHLFFGLLTGYQFNSFRIGKIIIIKQNNHLNIKKLAISGTGGQCLLQPPKYSVDFPYFLYNAGGGLFNLLVSFLSFILLLDQTNEIIKIGLISLSIINLYLGLVNLIPLRLAVPNDGYNILSIIKNPESRYSFYSQLQINYLQTNNIPFKDMDACLFWLPKDANLNNPLNQAILFAQVDSLHEQFKFHGAKILIEQILNNCQLIAYYSNSLKLEYLFYLIIEDEISKAKDLFYELKPFINQTLKNNIINCYRIMYAYELLINHDYQEAMTYYTKIENIIPSYPYPNVIKTEKQILALIKQISVEHTNKTSLCN